jgi:hypothetical protein
LRRRRAAIVLPATPFCIPDPAANPASMLDDRESLLRRLHEMRSEHRDLDTVIARFSAERVDQLQVQRLKKRKLKLKDEIARLESRLVPDIIA